MERVPQPDTGLTLFGLSHATSVLAITILVLAIYVLVDTLRPRVKRRRGEAETESAGFDWSEKSDR